MELYVRAVERAADTWSVVRTIPDYEIAVGKLLFREIFNIAPQALALYSFGEGYVVEQSSGVVPDSVFDEIYFQVHSRAVVGMLEMVVHKMADGDVSNLGDALETLGARHVSYGVLPAHYGVLETALLRTLQGGLKEMWTTEVRRSWAAVIKFISKGMQAGAAQEVQVTTVQRREYESPQKSATLRLSFIDRSEGSCTACCSRFHTGCTRDRSNDSRNQPPRMPTRGRRDTDLPMSPRRRQKIEVSCIPGYSCTSCPPRVPKRIPVDEDEATALTIALDDDDEQRHC